MAGIVDKDLYKAVYDAALLQVEKGNVPTKLLWSGQTLFRGVEVHYLHLIGAEGLLQQRYMTVTSARKNIIVRDQGSGNNRFSGEAYCGVQAPRGGCYFFTTESAGLAEMMHYKEREILAGRISVPMDAQTGRVSIPHLLATKGILKVTLLSSRLVANLNPADGTAISALLRSIEASSFVSKRLQGRTLETLMFDSQDYSVSRAIGHALMQCPYIVGLYAPSARDTERSQQTNETQDNLCFFGNAAEEISGLRMDSVYLFFEPGIAGGGDFFELPIEGFEMAVSP